MKQSKISNKKDKADYRNELFDFIVANGFECYVALCIDYPENNLFCGQVGEIEHVIIEEPDTDSYLVTFIDYKHRKQEEITQCLVKKEHLLPLFCFDPNTYEESIQEEDEEEGIMSINTIRNKWEELEFDIISTQNLVPHTKSETRFQVGELVTIQFDFEQTTKNDEIFIIQAGQIGIISDIKKDDCVEITFWTIPFGRLARVKKDFSFSSPSSPCFARQRDFNPFIYAINSWERKISIHKDFLFPLYCERLK